MEKKEIDFVCDRLESAKAALDDVINALYDVERMSTSDFRKIILRITSVNRCLLNIDAMLKTVDIVLFPFLY